MVVGAKGCELTDGFLWFVCGLYVGILTSPLNKEGPATCNTGFCDKIATYHKDCPKKDFQPST